MILALFTLLVPLACAETPVAASPPPPPPSGPATRWSFDAAPPGMVAPGFEVAQTGGGAPGRWAVVDDPAKPGNRALAQLDPSDDDGRYPMAVASAPAAGDVLLTVRCQMLAGAVDQACGLVFRWQDADNYYVTRANALEGNIRLYTVKGGSRHQIATWSGTVTGAAWHDFVVAVRGDRIEVWWDGVRVIDQRDSTFGQAGRVGVWTKADSVTWFDDLTVAPVAP